MSRTAFAYFVERYQSNVNRNLSPLFHLPNISDRYCGSRFLILRGFDRDILLRQILSFLTRHRLWGFQPLCKCQAYTLGIQDIFSTSTYIKYFSDALFLSISIAKPASVQAFESAPPQADVCGCGPAHVLRLLSAKRFLMCSFMHSFYEHIDSKNFSQIL
jgi:hypothetical protein